MAGSVEATSIELEAEDGSALQILTLDNNGRLVTRLDDGRNH